MVSPLAFTIFIALFVRISSYFFFFKCVYLSINYLSSFFDLLVVVPTYLVYPFFFFCFLSVTDFLPVNGVIDSFPFSLRLPFCEKVPKKKRKKKCVHKKAWFYFFV